ncbi:unnamed protein product [Arctia plantaginis]|uniref:Uncharacterized protein n=1 Tax=Arctia plantaginis TaxID=874455 RepID=A0A8S0YNT8_ARCPL|nr:unnamed protein product [Arctia plantaginis]
MASSAKFVAFAALLLLLNSIDCYSPKRQPRVTTTDSVYIDNFPEVEYPGSITDTIKPFYLNANPFSSDVQSSFKSLTSGGTTKSRPTIILNINASDNSKDKTKHKLVTPEKAIPTQENNISETDINLNDEKTSNKPSIVLFEDDFGCQETNKEVTSRAEEEESSIDSEMAYVLGFIDNLDDFITTREVETEFIDFTNSSMQIFDDEHSNEIATITSDVPLVNSFVAESNESSHTETNVFDELADNSTVASWLVNGGLTDSSDYNDTDLLIGKISNDTDML